MVVYTLALLAGIVGFQFVPQLPPLTWGLAATAVALGCWVKVSLRPLSVFLCALLWAWCHASLTLSSRLSEDYAGKDLLVQGYIENIPQAVSSDNYRFTFIVEQLQSESGSTWLPMTIKTRLRWYKNAPALRARESWQLRVRLKLPRGLANPGGFDYERWLFSQQFDATGYVRNSTENTQLTSKSCSHIDCWRQFLSEQIVASIQSDAAGLLVALAVGDKSGIDQQQWDMLRNTGTAHLMAISGLHIGLIAGLLFAVSAWLWKVFNLASFYPASRVAAVAAILGALAYSLLGGFSLPTQRALVMVSVFMCGHLLTRSMQPWRAICVSLALILLYDPLSVLASGFWLSFGAVAWIFYILSGRYGFVSKVKSALRIQAALALGLLPVLLLGFQQASLIAPVANIVAVPVVGLGVVPILLAGTVLLQLWPAAGSFLIQLAGDMMHLLTGFLNGLNALPISIWRQDAGSLTVAGLCLVSALFLLAPAGLAVRLAGLLLLGPLLFARTPGPATGELWLDLLDVGQGLSAVVRTRQHTLVYDTGPRSRSGFDTGQSVVAPFLLSRKLEHIDKLVISHSDNDHQGGAKSLFEIIRTDSVLAGMPDKIKFARSKKCQRGQRWEWDGVVFEILSPVERIRGNNASCVLQITAANGQKLLLTGDIESAIEQQLVNQYADSLRSTVLVVPHHGSRTSSTAQFVTAVAADTVLIPAGYANRFGFPKAAIVDRYRRQNAEIYVTGLEGTISVVLGRGDGPPRLATFRREARRYWRNTTSPEY